mmetsp:Transcript_87962/g.204699  ORF Transcript_87962/g.204699 Transcript_87962/m.204699 type:complete len:399 (-) Transcript_87962:79-1275(-)|eukprot:CAMPEP_0171062370 /NCGR_PEP_ID=MMETSP0766_2-20121228/5023_1 /TAXON_ID=439317 /ORGANISM="Gambierdiscus australes, Strain CAWD 149" /LENGTH=398 /DNA_ID=CAMNT_0011518167 /DNA_START=86 /DNA_END=1282 /DNA_ORIENTATION=+
MVATLAQPVELIRVQRRGSAVVKCAVAEMQGWRASHEDAHTVRCNETSADVWVLDGHRGDEAARFGAEALENEFSQAQAKKGNIMPSDKKIQSGVEAVDRKLRGHLQQQGRNAGSTVVGAFVTREMDGAYSTKLVNCGDSRAVLIRGPQERKTSAATTSIRLPQQLETMQQKVSWADDASWLPSWPAILETIDHKPGHPTERARIEAAGGKVSGGRRARIDGNLAVSRGLGDFDFKSDRGKSVSEQKVSCVPDIYEVRGVQAGALLLLACDGLWDVMTSEEASAFIRARLKKDPEADLGGIAAALIRFCLRMESYDNLTVMIVHLVDGSTWANAQDEIMGFEKLGGSVDKDTRKQYQNFLRKLQFPHDSLASIQDEEEKDRDALPALQLVTQAVPLNS